ncbi:uncharacterized protein LOC117602147 isoform X2 [Osmia lignaria lignaria]|uniref:uncharacterized protein LOC117602147 isoform X2 n=1 Tax=Osmia lignaria lignaria TaxID=1437193 RepID=UPI001478A5D6|nr:uncharacterized protein LOC117602147 isoform X2 [Osmia lignaria]
MLPRTSKTVPSPLGLGYGQIQRGKKGSRILECVCRRSSWLLLLLSAVLFASLYVVSFEENYEFDFPSRYRSSYGSYNVTEGTMDGYLVWNSRCQMLSKKPMDPSIRAYVKKEKFQRCSNEPPLTGVSRDENGSVILSINPTVSTLHPGLQCCWAPIFRPENKSAKEKANKRTNLDSSIVVKRCEKFDVETRLPDDAQAAMVSCTAKPKKGGAKATDKPIYENVHPILSVEKVRDRLGQRNANRSIDTNRDPLLSRKLSVLLLGIDSVSRLNFMRSAPNTDKYLQETGWIRLNGYNKMGDNTFPNLMAILTGQNQAQAYSRCKPTVPYILDRCPFLWHKFREAGYATAYGEDETSLNTFNYLKVGFVEPPTDYYLRPYMLACEKLLKVKKRFGLKYCTGPESSFDRILDYAVDFSRAFLGLPYFGLFWTISVSHENANGLSSMDARLLDKLKRLEREGVLNDTMIVFLSDHGMRWGPIRSTLVGWYEERLPFLYVWLPEWFRVEQPEAYPSLRANQHRLVSPFDLYETLRQVLDLSGGEADPSPGCSGCRSLLEPLPRERGCSNAGISLHWCACTAFEPVDLKDPLVHNGVSFFIEHVDKLLDAYKDRKGRRLCAKLRLKKLIRANRAIDFVDTTSLAYFYTVQVSPGDGKFEVTVRYHDNATYTVSDHEVSRLNSYASTAKCLEHGMKQYCHCLR